MMIDEEGCGLIIAILAVIGLILGLVGVWLFKLPSWTPIVSAIGLPITLLAMSSLVALIFTDWSH